jgi:hypothetical protein
MAVRIERIFCTVLHEAHEEQVTETMNTLSEGPEGFYKTSHLYKKPPVSPVNLTLGPLFGVSKLCS